MSAGAAASESKAFLKLTYEQTKALDCVLDSDLELRGRGNFPTLRIKLKDFVQLIRRRLVEDCGIRVTDIRLNGGAASWVIGSADCQWLTYNDVDVIFCIKAENEHALHTIKDCVMDCVLHSLPSGAGRDRLRCCASLSDAYVRKMKKVWTDADRWSLISLFNSGGRNLELKFVDRMKRQFEFSVDSFQIILNGLLQFDSVVARRAAIDSRDFYPSVIAESKYGDFGRALYHLQTKLIATVNPAEIRGGGLLKYCQLRVRGFLPDYTQPERATLERYMCSRFFIDFPDWNQQYHKLDSYLADHFGSDYQSMLDYLGELHAIVEESTVCLMNHERQMALQLIRMMGFHVWYERERLAHGGGFELDELHLFSPEDGFVVDQVFYGPGPYSGVTPLMQPDALSSYPLSQPSSNQPSSSGPYPWVPGGSSYLQYAQPSY